MPMIPGPKEQSVAPDGQLNYQSSAGATPDAFGGSIGQAAQQAGQSADNIAMRGFAIKNETDSINGNNQLMAKLQDLQNGNQEIGEVGFRNLIGTNAVNALPDYQRKVQDSYKEIRASLPNPAVQRAFDTTALRIVRGTTDSMGAWSSQQNVVGQHQETRAGVDLARNAGLTHADEPGGWDKYMSDLAVASTKGSDILGLGPDARQNQLEQDVGTAYLERTRQLMNRDPMEAANFFNDHIGSFYAPQVAQLKKEINLTTDAVQARDGGLASYRQAIGQPSAPALPQTIPGASDKAFDQPKISQVASLVKSPTPWDSDIAAAAKTFNVNPNEIRLKMAVESSNNPSAVNPDGLHVGLGQFDAATAARYGITDRTDPVQSINGIAKMLAANGGTNGGDMGAADRAYFGGNVDAKGPNTDQYVENTRAARQALMGGGAPAPLNIVALEGKEADVVLTAQANAEAQRPGNVAFRDRMVGEARRNWSIDLAALKGEEYSNYSTVLQTSVGQDQPVRAMSDLPVQQQRTFAALTPEHQQGLQMLWQRNQTRDDKAITPDDTRKFLSLQGQAITDPVAFKNRDIASDIADLPKPYQSQVLNLYTSIDKQTAKGVSYSRALGDPQVVKMLQSAKVAIPGPTQKQPTDDYNVFASRMKDSLDTYFTQHKRNPTNPELLQMAGSLLTPGKVSGGTFWDSSSPAFKADPSKFYVPLPGGDQGKQLTDSFTKVMGHAPSQPELQQWYTRYKMSGGQ